MRLILLLAFPLLLAAETFEESLFLRRIAEFWQEGEYQIVKNQIEEFTEEYPESEYKDPLSAALGDLFLREKNFTAALNSYSQVQSEELKELISFHRMECLYALQWYATLADECEAYLQAKEDPQVTYFLAISLYQQTLNSPQNEELLLQLAKRAEPHFKKLFETYSTESTEIGQAYAHLCTLLGDFPKAAQIYLDLAKNKGENTEELLFLAAFAQTKYDRESARETFAQIETMGATRVQEAAYNHFVLSFELGHYEELIQHRDKFLAHLPTDRLPLAHLLLGRSYLNAKRYKEAIGEFQTYLRQPHTSPETLHTALLNLLEASFQGKDLAAFDAALNQMTVLNPEDPELAKAHFSRAQILKQDQELTSAQGELEQLLSLFPASPQRSLALFELTHIDHQTKNWTECRKRASDFLQEFPNHELAPFAWRYLLASNSHLGLREELISDLGRFLESDFLTPAERSEWQVQLAKAHYELKNYAQCLDLLADSTEPNGYLLQALSHRDGEGDIEQFCKFGEMALEKGETLLEQKQLHLALFNGYLERSDLDRGADHLFAAFELGSQIEEENLLWLADFYTKKGDFAPKAKTILEKVLAVNPSQTVAFKLAKLYSLFGQIDQQIALLEKFTSLEDEALLLLAEGYVLKENKEKAGELFESILRNSSTLRNPTSASASLQLIRLKIEKGNFDKNKLATDLKNLILQKTLVNEPIYLEAALDYIDLQSTSPEKRLELLIKTKADFEKADDLLSQDYQAARSKYPEKNKIYENYMRWIDAEICRTESEISSDEQLQKQLQTKTKDLLLQIREDASLASLNERVRRQFHE